MNVLQKAIERGRAKIAYIKQAPCREGNHDWYHYSAQRVIEDDGNYYLAYSVPHRECKRCNHSQWSPRGEWVENTPKNS